MVMTETLLSLVYELPGYSSPLWKDCDLRPLCWVWGFPSSCLCFFCCSFFLFGFLSLYKLVMLPQQSISFQNSSLLVVFSSADLSTSMLPRHELIMHWPDEITSTRLNLSILMFSHSGTSNPVYHNCTQSSELRLQCLQIHSKQKYRNFKRHLAF